MLAAVSAGIFGNLTDAGCPEIQTSTLTGSFDSYLSTTYDDLRTSGKEGTTAIHITDDDLRCRQHQPLGITHIAAFLQLCHHVEFHLLHLSLALADLRQVFLYTALEVGEFFLPILEYIVHILPFLLFYLFYPFTLT